MNNKIYIRIGRRFVPVPKKEDAIGMWFNITSNNPTDCFLSKEDRGEETIGIVVGIKSDNVVIALKGAKKVPFSKVKDDCKDGVYLPEIEELRNARKYLAKLYNKFISVYIWSNTIFNKSSRFAYQYYLNLHSNSWYIGRTYADDSNHFFAQMFITKPIREILDTYEYIKTK